MNLECRLEIMQEANSGNVILCCLMQHHLLMVRDCTMILECSTDFHNSDVLKQL